MGNAGDLARFGGMARQLKVFRTAIGFHDAYVAATSRKAALAAWGADVDLFARGVAEQVTDPALMADALAVPGEVVRKVRGTADEHFAALPKTPARARKAEPKVTLERRSASRRKNPPPPKPTREALDSAEAAIARAEAAYDAQRRDLANREAALARERRALDRAREDEQARLDAARDEAEAAYREAMIAWREAN